MVKYPYDKGKDVDMKKIFLCSLLACLVSVGGSYGGDVNSSCYAVKGTYFCNGIFLPYCGGKVASTWIGALYGLGTGSVVGGAAGSLFGAFGTGAGVVAGGYAGAKLGAKIGKNYKANEYIYFEDGSCLECDKHQTCEDFECPNRTVVTNGNKAYMCHVEGAGDHWKEYTPPVCSDSIQPGHIDPNKKYKTYLKDNATNNGKKIKDGVLAFSSSVCIYTEEDCGCPECCGDTQTKPEPVKPSKPNTSKKTCDEMYKGYPERIACCKAGKSTRWDGSISNGTCSCVDKSKTWNGKNCVALGNKTCEELYPDNKEAVACCKLEKEGTASWNNELKQCECVGENKEWDKKELKCKDVDSKPETVSGKDCVYTLNMDINCKNGQMFKKGYQVKLTEDEAQKFGGCEQAKEKITSIETLLETTKKEITQYGDLIKLVCGDGSIAIVPVTPDNNKEIEAAKSTLRAFFKSAETNTSVWKDAEGNFNTARLASDLTAGVVLGTVGGVVSGVVIKKKQVEKGFEALHCTVGGQTVADWGDTFNVGLQRY